MSDSAEPPRPAWILVIDGDGPLQLTLQRYLTNLGFETLVASDGWQGLELLITRGETSPAALFVETQLAEANEGHLLREIHRISPVLKRRVILVGSAISNSALVPLASGSVVPKPLWPKALKSALEAVGAIASHPI